MSAPLNCDIPDGSQDDRDQPITAPGEQPAAPSTDAAIKFMKAMQPDGVWTFTAIQPDGDIKTRTFLAGQEQQAHDWVERFNGKWNLYWMPNPPTHALTKKGDKKDIKECGWFWVDCDPRVGEPVPDEQNRILDLFGKNMPAGVPQPTALIFSGGGYQALWKLETPIPINGDLVLAEDAERYNRKLELLFGADHCHNVDRVLRLPFTLNIPTKKKAKDRVPVVAHVLECDPTRVHPESAFTKAPAKNGTVSLGPIASVNFTSGPLPRVELDDLPAGVSQRIKSIIVQGDDSDQPYPSRSEALWAVTCEMIRAGCSDQTVAAVLLDRDLGVSQHVYRQGRPQDYTARQIKRAKEAVASEFKCDEDGKIVSSNQHNIRLALHKLGVTLSHDEFQDQMLVTGMPEIGPLLDDRAMEHLWLLVDETFSFRPSKEFFWTVASVTARKNNFHPVREYLDSLQWDGIPRVDGWLHAYGGAQDTAYTRAVGALMLVAAVRRIRKPGIKFDEMLVLESSQGTDKSSALKILAVKDHWFSDDLPLSASGKEVIERQRGRWIVECAELQGMRKSDLEHIKAFLSRQTDRARLSYDRLTTEVSRQSVFFGTTNSLKYLRDVTGARRFWPVGICKFDLPALTRDRDQLWAEAVVREARGDSIRLDPSLYDAAAVEQHARTVDDPFREQLEHVLDGLTGKILNADAWEIIGVPVGVRDQTHNSRLGEAMKSLGWERTEARIEGKKRNVYARGTKPEREVRIHIIKDQSGRVSAQADDKSEPEVGPDMGQAPVTQTELELDREPF